jgi:hypothetical protein
MGQDFLVDDRDQNRPDMLNTPRGNPGFENSFG